MFTGIIITESLEDQSVLNGLVVTKTEVEQISNPAQGQPSDWHLVSFEVSDEAAGEFAQKCSRALRPSTWYIDFMSEDGKYVVFPGKVFYYQRGDMEKRKEAQAYGISLGIPEPQLDWAE